MSEERIYGWHFTDGRQLGWDATEVRVDPGYVYTYYGLRPMLYSRGLHASRTVLDAWDWFPMGWRAASGLGWLSRVVLWGSLQEESGKNAGVARWSLMCARHREVLWMLSPERVCAVVNKLGAAHSRILNWRQSPRVTLHRLVRAEKLTPSEVERAFLRARGRVTA